MKIKIDKDGILNVERAGKFKMQECPYSIDSEGYARYCGDWCPLFSEPKQAFRWDYKSGDHILTDDIEIYICGAIFTTHKNDFIDERKHV